MIERDETIDRLRGIAMIWVIAVHALYWGAFCSDQTFNLLKSFFLFEMPLFFFVTGAANSFSRSNSYSGYVYKRFKRILIPYWVFAIICAGLTIAKIIRREGGIDPETAVKIIGSWLVPIDKQITSIQYLTWAVWFIPVYLCVVLTIPLLKKIKLTKISLVFILVLLVLFVLSCVFSFGWFQNVFFYVVWTYIGLFYSEIKASLCKNSFKRLLTFIALCSLSALAVLRANQYSLDMQANKFPPNIAFCFFSIAAMSLIILALPFIDRICKVLCKYKLIDKAFNLFSTRSLTVYLYQVFAFTVTIKAVNYLLHGDTVTLGIIKTSLCFFLTLPLCVLGAALFGKIEDMAK
ncbi:MAG: acyltransferase [Oscillospiraceae bacterium]|nr:acyltransferase [Oscillospiraceae bacterium]